MSMKIQLPDLDRMPNVNKEVIFKYLETTNLTETVVSYVVDSDFRHGVNLRNWILPQLDDYFLKVIVETEDWINIKNEDKRVLAILKYWKDGGKGGLTYKGDMTNYKRSEYWATVKEILDLRIDDCEGFANIIYNSCRLAGIPDNRLYITASDVVGGGHCYVIYVANNGLEYPIDGCYWTSISLMLKVPYVERTEYYGGTKEWFRFNATGMYKLKE